MGRIERERLTLKVMIGMFCRDKHGSEHLCDCCSDLLSYAAAKTVRCPFKEAKPVCASCSTHCYRGAPEKQAAIRAIMRYCGPRMLWRHPGLALLHLLDTWRFQASRTSGKRSGASVS